MAVSFSTDLSGKLAERWLANLLTPAFVFWAGGLAAWIDRAGNGSQEIARINGLIQQIAPLPNPWKITLIIAGLLLIAISALIVERLDLPMLRFLEGYWSRWLYPVWAWGVRQQRTRFRRDRWRFECLAKKQTEGLSADELDRYRSSYYPRWLRPVRRKLLGGTARSRLPQAQLDRLHQRLTKLTEQQARGNGEITALTAEEWHASETIAQTIAQQLQQAESRFKGLTLKEAEEYARLDWQLRQFPTQLDRIMPTRLGNRLRAAETRPQDKYGLDALLCWPRLWLVLPDGVKKSLQEARQELNIGARVWLWSVLFLLWGYFAWWAVPAGLLFAWLSYRWMLNTAAAYGELVEAAFDLHRTQLYKALRLPLPEDPADERQKGQELTTYLLGSPPARLKFTQPEEKPGGS